MVGMQEIFSTDIFYRDIFYRVERTWGGENLFGFDLPTLSRGI
jgi:hypothetical protein